MLKTKLINQRFPKNIIELLKGSEKEFGKILELYEKKFFTEMSVNIETSIYLAILFLFGIGKIDIENKKIKEAEAPCNCQMDNLRCFFALQELLCHIKTRKPCFR